MTLAETGSARPRGQVHRTVLLLQKVKTVNLIDPFVVNAQFSKVMITDDSLMIVAALLHPQLTVVSSQDFARCRAVPGVTN